MKEPNESLGPGQASAAERAAQERLAGLSAAANRGPRALLLKMAGGAAAAYGLYYMWSHSEEPLPKPMEEAVRAWMGRGGQWRRPTRGSAVQDGCEAWAGMRCCLRVWVCCWFFYQRPCASSHHPPTWCCS